MDRPWQDRLPVGHHPAIVEDALGQILHVIGPADAAEVGHPTGHGHVAHIPADVDQRGVRKQQPDETEIQVVVRHLVHNAGRLRVGALTVQHGLHALEVVVGQFAQLFGPIHLGRQSIQRLAG